mmetsp:Transcript_7874/g.11236  ORF Transcript_7874/g.11236 Transcript_7874/m.11236 type:complete len:641 (-) Transcript_7874:246-2168(-)|eukprot:CAMPEP_0184872812 /NCGR_PEP_ID=MMETSP0580-20130426/41499_1 /TAXON_ID=1118495 /ORGANISM="Dactyliosolen fragilissimus" /LENGTH=640 /DNA_ID=CAMNT_0027375657 /DNA_START=104 /DNA_END=2026 /DNA_ORIENTATION=-
MFPKAMPMNGQRHELEAETELRLEVPHGTSITLTLLDGTAEIFGAEMAMDQSSSAATTNAALATATNSTTRNTTDYSKQSYHVEGNAKLAIYTWHGCTLDVDVELGKKLDISYTSKEVAANVSYVNTHAQLEVLRDEALHAGLKDTNDKKSDTAAAASGMSLMPGGEMFPVSSSTSSSNAAKNDKFTEDGPRVLLVGPPDCGKTSLARVLTSYAVKLGRTPILVDLDVSQNMLSIPGTITASPITPESISVTTHAAAGSNIVSNTTPLVLWYGSTDPATNPDLYKAQLDKLGHAIDVRLGYDSQNNKPNKYHNTENKTNNNSNNIDSTLDARASGIIVNTSGWIEDMGYQLLLHASKALRINVILVIGHDRLYSMLQSHFDSRNQNNNKDNNLSSSPPSPKVIKLPRSGGVVSRDQSFRRISRNLCIRRYFHGDLLRKLSTATPNSSSSSATTTSVTSSSSANTNTSLVHQYTPTLIELPFSDLHLYKLTNVSLAASMLPVSSKQTTDPVQLVPVLEITQSLTHAILAICHPTTVERYIGHSSSSSKNQNNVRQGMDDDMDINDAAADNNRMLSHTNAVGTEMGDDTSMHKDGLLYLTGVAGFVAVERVDVDREIISFLSPCSGSLPSHTLLMGDITWME